jgi:hypothetical protein
MRCPHGSAEIPKIGNALHHTNLDRIGEYGKRRGCRAGAMRPPWSIGFRMPRAPILTGGAPALATRGSAFAGQVPVGGPTSLRDPRAASSLTYTAAGYITSGCPSACPATASKMGTVEKRRAPLPLNCLEPTFTRPLPKRRSRPTAVRLCITSLTGGYPTY